MFPVNPRLRMISIPRGPRLILLPSASLYAVALKVFLDPHPALVPASPAPPRRCPGVDWASLLLVNGASLRLNTLTC
jgi:hypothetical protein